MRASGALAGRRAQVRVRRVEREILFEARRRHLVIGKVADQVRIVFERG
jgi:hypothetical protein